LLHHQRYRFLLKIIWISLVCTFSHFDTSIIGVYPLLKCPAGLDQNTLTL
jgi:hypothetical protein